MKKNQKSNIPGLVKRSGVGKYQILRNLQPTTNNLQPALGQIVLILVLITVVGLTIGLSLISRTITDIRISSQIEESGRAFSAAEAGVETALRGSTVNETRNLTFTGAEASYRVETLGGTTSVFTFPMTEVGKVQTVWLMEHNSDGTLNETVTYPVSTADNNVPIDLCWGSEADNNAALVMTLLYKDTDGQYKIAKAAYDPVVSRSTNSLNGNNFNIVDETAGGYCDGSFRFKKTINDAGEFWDYFTLDEDAKLLALRLQPVYQATGIGVRPTAAEVLPSQGKQIISLGKTETGVVRKIQVTQGYLTLPEVFDFTYFSEM